MKPKMLVVGEVCVELTLNVSSLPSPNIIMYEDNCEYEFSPGGSGGNAAVCAEKLGMQTYLCAHVGNDGNASRLRTYYYENNIDTSKMITDVGSKTGMLVTINDSEYKNKRMISYPGASLNFQTDDIDKALDISPGIVFLKSDIPFDIVEHVVNAAERVNAEVFLDLPEFNVSESLSRLGRVGVLYMSEKSAEAITEIAPVDIEKSLKCCIAVSQQIKADYYIINHKNRGLFVYDGKFYNIIVACDRDIKRSKSVYADICSAALACEYAITGDIVHSCFFAEIADKLAREYDGIKIPTRSQVNDYIISNSLKTEIFE